MAGNGAWTLAQQLTLKTQSGAMDDQSRSRTSCPSRHKPVPGQKKAPAPLRAPGLDTADRSSDVNGGISD